MSNLTIDQEQIALFDQASSVVVLTGAGISAESGVPTFRDAQQGLWAKYSPQELASPTAFQRQPKIVLQWYQWRMEIIRKSQPNPAHYSLVKLEKLCHRQGKDFILITQNVDNLHQRAGSRKILELHGNIFKTRCHRCRTDQEIDLAGINLEEDLPRCQKCPGLLRPDVVWFGESLSRSALEDAWKQSLEADYFLLVGTSAAVQPAASLPLLSLEQGGTLIEINPKPSGLSHQAHFHLPYPAGKVLPILVKALEIPG